MKVFTTLLLMSLAQVYLIAQSPLIPFVVDEDPPAEDADSLLEDADPQVLNMEEVREAIGYPKAAVDANIEGRVVIRMLVNKDGTIHKYHVLEKAHPLLIEAVQKKVERLRFSRAVVNGKLIRFWVNVPFNFQLIESEKEEYESSRQPS